MQNLLSLFSFRSALFLLLFAPAAFAFADKGALGMQKDGVRNERPHYMDDVGIDEKLGETIDLNLQFTDAHGKEVVLGDYFNEKPVFMMLIYYTCPTLCSVHFSTLIKSFREFDWSIGDKYEFVAVSIDPRETSEDAKEKQDLYFSEYGRPESADGWHFLTGDEENIKRLASQIGFKYVWDSNISQWAHTAAAYVLTPNGRISYYHYGLDIDPKALRLSLVEASENKIGNIVDRLILFCMQYDPNKKTYAFYAYNIMRVAAALAGLALVGFLAWFWLRERDNEV